MIYKLKVFHIVESLDVGGMENGIVNLANHIDYSRFDYGICCFFKKGRLAERLQDNRTELLQLDYAPGFNLAAIFPLSKILKKHRVDIVHTHGWGARSFLGLLAAKLARVPICVNGEHGVIHDKKKFQLTLQKVIAPYFDGTLAVSESLKEKVIIRLGLRGENITVIPNGVDVDKFHGRYCTEKLKKEFISSTDKPVIIAVIGSLKRQKNQKVVIEAVKQLKVSGLDIKLLLIGNGPDRKRLQGLVEKLEIKERVHFIGTRNDIPELLSIIDILVLPSIPDHEGMSNVILEAMASRVPVVTTLSVGAQELIENGVSGLFFKYDKPNHLVRQLQVVIENKELQESVKRNATETIMKNRSIEVMVKSYENYYLQIAGVK